MEQQQYTIIINASRQQVWDTLWQAKTFRDWAGLIDPGTYMAGELKAGNKVQFISAEGYGVTSLVESIAVPESLVLRHKADTQANGTQARDDEWTGGQESYYLTEAGGTTTLKVAFDVPQELKAYFKLNYPKAMDRLKQLAEKR